MTGIMERVAERLSDLYAWRKPFSIEARSCGAPGASWSLEERKVILCYEIAEEFVQLYKLHGEDPFATLSPSAGSRSGAPMGFK